MNHLNHLIPAAAAELDRPVEERISRLRRPFWIGYTRAQTILEKIEHLLGHPGTHRMPSLLLAGDRNWASSPARGWAVEVFVLAGLGLDPQSAGCGICAAASAVSFSKNFLIRKRDVVSSRRCPTPAIMPPTCTSPS